MFDVIFRFTVLLLSDPVYYHILQGSGSATQGEISFVSWNAKAQHIFASTSYNGTTGEEK